MTNIQIIQLLSTLLIVSAAVFSILIYRYKKKLIKKNQDAIFLSKKSRTNYLLILYQFFSEWKLTKKYIKKIRRQFKILYPSDKKRIYENTIKVALFIWSISAIIIVFIIVARPALFTMIIMFSVIYIFSNQLINIIVNREEIKILHQFEKFLGDVRHHFFVHQMIDEAIYDSLEEADHEIELHASKIYEILSSDNMDEEVTKYNENVPNRFLKAFLALCVTIIHYGDKEVNGESLFLSNLKNLKQEIYVEILKRQKINYMFSGLIFVTSAPMFFLKAIEDWGINNIPELELYYKGSFGIIVTILIFAITLISYNLINQLKEIREAEVKEHIILEQLVKIKPINKVLTKIIDKYYGKMLLIQDLLKKVGESITMKQFLFKRILYCIGSFFFCILLSFLLHYNSRNFHLNYVNNIANLSSSASKKQLEDMKALIIGYANYYKKEKVTAKDVEKDILARGVMKSKQLMTLSAEEIVRRVNEYQNEYYKWYELIITIGISVLVYYIPYWLLLYRKKILQMSMEDEVIQFQSIILMLMHIDQMTVENILEWLESFAVIFKVSIQECLNDFASGDAIALEDLKLKEPFEPFVRIVENLEMCDKIGIEKAFNEVAVERTNFQEKRKQENEIYINNKALIGKVIAYIPLILTIGLYLIVPFILESLSQLISYITQIQAM